MFAHHWNELLAFVQGIVSIHEDTLGLGLKVLLPLLGIDRIVLCLILARQWAVAQLVHSCPAQYDSFTPICIVLHSPDVRCLGKTVFHDVSGRDRATHAEGSVAKTDCQHRCTMHDIAPDR